MPVVKFRYVDTSGAFLPGIPARDLTDEDLEALTEEQRAAIAECAIYQAAAGKNKPAPPADGEG